MTKKLAFYLGFLALLTIILWFATETYFVHRPERVVWNVKTVKLPPSLPVLNANKLIRQPLVTNSQMVVASPEGSCFAVLSAPNTLTILSQNTGKIISLTVTSSPIKNVTWVTDRMLFFMTASDTLYTYDVRANRIRLIHTFAVPSGETFRTIAFSPYTNDVFVIFGSESGNTVYQFNTNEEYYVRSFENIDVVRAYYGSTNMTLYIEDSNHSLYRLKGGYIASLQNHIEILKGAGNELYYAQLNKQNKVVSVAKYDDVGVSHLICKLDNPVSIDNVIVDHTGKVFVVEDGQLLDVTGHERWTVPAGYKLKFADNTILLTKGEEYRTVVN